MHIAHNRYFGDDKTGLIIEAQIDGVDTHRIHVALCTPFRIESVKVVHGDD